MTKQDMIFFIQTSSKENTWALIEADTNAFTRFVKRHLFFEALKDLEDYFDMPKDEWEE